MSRVCAKCNLLYFFRERRPIAYNIYYIDIYVIIMIPKYVRLVHMWKRRHFQKEAAKNLLTLK